MVTAAALSGEEAKQALLDLMASRDSGVVSRSHAKRFAGEPVVGGGTTAEWGPFRLDLAARRYEFWINYGSPPKMNREAYEGKFERRDGRWVALPPQVLWRANGVKEN